ncbi:MAG: hypothetical protein ACR2GJ_09240 [Gemmatimonadaceae bacterium]
MPDATANLARLARELRAAALDVLWRQWRVVGGQTATRGGANAIVDPEALVLLSLTLMESEPRLRDVLHDWTILNSDLISVQRLKNLGASYSETTRERLSWLARIATEKAKDLRWRSFLAGDQSGNDPASRNVLVRANNRRAIRVRLDEPAALALRLRLGFGVGAKADVLVFLIGNDGDAATVREIAAETGYTVAAARRAAEDMAAARLLHSTTAQPVMFRADTEAWAGVLGLSGGAPPWRSWNERFAFVAAYLSWSETMSTRPFKPYAFGVKGRELLERHKAAFELDHIAVWSEHSAVPDWAAFVSGAVKEMAGWMRAAA